MITSFNDIKFPVYLIGNKKPEVIDGVVFFVYIKNTDEGQEAFISVIDDKNIEGKTLAERRIRLMSDNVKLKKLSVSIHFVHDFIKYAKSHLWFIDSAGTLFKYKKSIKAKLVYKKITTVINLPKGGSIIELADIPDRYKTLYRVPKEHTYAGVLVSSIGNLFYGTYDRKYKESHRLI